jgi:hypothetical protein
MATKFVALEQNDDHNSAPALRGHSGEAMPGANPSARAPAAAT